MSSICDLVKLARKHIHEGAGNPEQIRARIRAETGIDLDDHASRFIFQRGGQAHLASGGKALLEAERGIRLALAKEMQSATRSGVTETIQGLGRAGMLSSPRTLARNLIGNALSAATDEISRIPGAMMDAALGKLTGQRTFLGPQFQSAARSIAQSVTKGTKDFAETMKHGATEADLIKYDVPRELNLGENIAGKVVGGYVNFVNRLQSGSDKWARVYAYTRSIDEQAELVARGEKLTGQAKKERIIELRGNPTEQMAINAAGWAEEAVFANSNVLSNIVTQGKRVGGDPGKLLIDAVVPFVRTPTNIYGRVIEHTPLALGKLIQLSLKGVKDPTVQREFSKTWGRAAVGSTAMFGLGRWLYDQGVLTPGASYSPGERGREEAAGRQPASIKIGDTWMGIADSPVGQLLALGAAYRHEMTDPNKTLAQKVTGLSKRAGQQFVDQPMMQGAKELTNAERGLFENIAKVGESYATRYVPNVLADTGKITDPHAREVLSTSDALKERTPGRQSLPVKVDALGKPIQSRTAGIYTALPFGGITDKSNDPIIKALDKYRIPLSVVMRDKEAGETDKQYLDRKQRTGKAVYEALKEIIDDPTWKEAQLEVKQGKSTNKELRDYLMNAIRSTKARISKEFKYERSP